MKIVQSWIKIILFHRIIIGNIVLFLSLMENMNARLTNMKMLKLKTGKNKNKQLYENMVDADDDIPPVPSGPDVPWPLSLLTTKMIAVILIAILLLAVYLFGWQLLLWPGQLVLGFFGKTSWTFSVMEYAGLAKTGMMVKFLTYGANWAWWVLVGAVIAQLLSKDNA